MPGKRPRQIQRTTSMLQLGGGGMVMGARFSLTAPENFQGDAGAPYRELSAPLKQEPLETMEVCAGAEDAVAQAAFMEDDFNSMAIDDSVEESPYASHAVRPGVYQANHPGAQNPSFHQCLHPGYLPHPSQNKAMTSQASVCRGLEAGRSAQQGHFLDVCNRCSKRLGHGRDVFIYRGDRAFCSVECRHSQIVADEMRENEMREKCGMAAAKEGLGSNTPARNPPGTKQVETAAAA